MSKSTKQNPNSTSKKHPFTPPNTQTAVLSTLQKRISSSQEYDENLPFLTHKPANETVILSELLDEIVCLVKSLIILEDHQAHIIALWVFHTYVLDLCAVTPILIIDAPEKACAKSRLLSLVADLSLRPLPSSNCTTAATFRSIEIWHPTMFFDEADTFMRDNNELAGIINAGNSRKNAFVLRNVMKGDDYLPAKFSVFSAKAIAGIALSKHLKDTTISRGVTISMRRKMPDEKVVSLRDIPKGKIPKLCGKLMKAAVDFCDAIDAVRPAFPEALSDRACDNWEVLFQIATVAGDDWLARAQKAALTISKFESDNQSTANELLSDIRVIFDSFKHQKPDADRISTAELLDLLCKIPDAPWNTYNIGKPITPRQLAKILSEYKIKPRTVRLGNGNTPKGYMFAQFNDAFSRYLTTKTTPENIIDIDGDYQQYGQSNPHQEFRQTSSENDDSAEY